MRYEIKARIQTHSLFSRRAVHSTASEFVAISSTSLSLGKVMATKKAAKKATKGAKPAANKPIKEVLGKSGLVDYIAATSELMAKDVRAVLAALEGAVIGSVNKNGARTFILPGLLKITVASIPAKPKRKGVNPFTKQEQWFAAKPASVRVKVRPLKKLKDAAA
jgi:nucleoid DNA-binding protein